MGEYREGRTLEEDIVGCDPVVIVVRRGIDRVGILIERFSLDCTEENAIPTDDDAGFVPIRTQSESTWREIERQSVDRIE